MKTILNRYEIRSELGRGGTGVVYEAYDSKDRTLVALKTIHSADVEGLFRLKHEFRALADVHHENLVRLGELACDDGNWYFTMELVRGKDFIEYVRPAHRRPLDSAHPAGSAHPPPARPPSDSKAPGANAQGGLRFDEARLRNALGQLVSALATVHAAGHIHRDIKPSNVLVTQKGRVVLLDFGLVTAVGPSRTPDAPWLVGSPAFMAPEQIELGNVGPAADCYAVGVMLFLAMTGTLPFDGTATEMMTAKLTRAAPLAREREPGAPADLEALCAELLSDSPSQRPDAAAIRERLGIAGSAYDTFTTNVAAPHAVFVGRHHELTILRSALEGATADRGSTIVVVDGEPGMGKTALVRQFLQSVGDHTLVLSGRCYEQETVPFKGVDAIVDALSAHLVALSDDEVASILAGGVRYLATVFKVLERVPLISEMTSRLPEISGTSAVREQAFVELERLLRTLARRSPLVLFLDDLQWCDKDSVGLLRRALPSAPNAGCFLITTMRSNAEIHPELSELLANATRISLSGLSEEEANTLWSEVVRQQPGAARAGPQDFSLLREVAGHPLFLAELARAAKRGPLARNPAASLQDVLWRRIQERDAVDQRLLQMVAVAGVPTPYEVLARAADTTVGDCHVRLAGLRAAQLIRVSRHGEERLVEPYHTRITEALLSHLDEAGATDSLAASRLRLGWALLEGTTAEALERRIFTIVRYLNASSTLLASRPDRIRVAGLDLIACRRARLATAYEQARDYAHAGLALLGESGWVDAYEVARDLHAEGMAAETFAGNYPIAKELFQNGMSHAVARADKAKFVNSWVELETSVEHVADAISVGREWLRERGVHLPEDAAEIDRRIGDGIATMQGHLAKRVIEDLVRLPEMADEEITLAMTILRQLVPAAIQTQPRLFVLITLIMFDLTLTYGVTPSSCKNLLDSGIIQAGILGDYDSAYRLAKVAFTLLERYTPSPLESSVHFVFAGYVSHWRAHYRESLTSFVEAERKGLETGDIQHVAYAHAFHVLRLFLVGRPLDECHQRAKTAAEYLRQVRTLIQLPGVEFVARVVSKLSGKAADAARLELSDDEFTETLLKSDTSHRFTFGQAQLMTCFILSDFDAAARWDAFTASYVRAGGSLFSLPDYVLFQSLLVTRRWAPVSDSERTAQLKVLDKNQSKLKKWADNCPENFLHKYQLLSAEIARIRGEPVDDVVERYTDAVASMGREFMHIRALATELHAEFWIEQKRSNRAVALLQEAYYGYQRWGAEAKLRQLEHAYGHILGLAPQSERADATK